MTRPRLPKLTRRKGVWYCSYYPINQDALRFCGFGPTQIGAYNAWKYKRLEHGN